MEKTTSGLLFKSLKEGTGESPKATDTVKVHYRGTLTSGVEFDSSYARNEPAEFPLNRVIACWTEGANEGTCSMSESSRSKVPFSISKT